MAKLFLLTDGEIDVEGNSQKNHIGNEVFIPANSIHTFSNILKTNNV